MATDPELLDHVLDLFSGLGRVTTARMFSGTALYVEGDVMFAVVISDTVYMKSDAATAPAYAEAGALPFSYDDRNGRHKVTSLLSLPESAMDDAEEALAWARLSLPPARAAAAVKRRQKARKAAARR
ncbi:TfoX/Sxy family protein [Solirhodobacter olei]|uniref:TfoX/Sxy family protein n=1 Tax=Solirhodobacter olei TaxID=2493082 RepID=UPI000FDBEBE9|nr:TfoX/Sxy family protein [Solirhodobacter olei]